MVISTKFLQDVALLDPRLFDNIAREGARRTFMGNLSEAIKHFDGDVTATVLRDDITDLARN